MTAPVHRESIISLTPIPIPRGSISMSQKQKGMRVYTPMMPSTAPVSQQQQQERDSGGDGEDGPYADWMSRFCVEPRNDADTCCLGFWVTCALYGKTHWRLKQINRGKDATDSNWKGKDGCNEACCAWFGVWGCCFCHPLAGILTGLQRAQIRGTYGIKGNCASDVALGIFCTACTQMQSDREVRAREGDMRMRYNPEYRKQERKHEIVNTEPKRTPPMTYVSPREHLEHCPQVQLCYAYPSAPHKLQKPQKNEKKDRTSVKKLKVSKSQGSLKSYNKPPTIRVTQYEDDTPQSEKSRSVFDAVFADQLHPNTAESGTSSSIPVTYDIVPERISKPFWGRKVLLLGRLKPNKLSSIPEQGEKGVPKHNASQDENAKPVLSEKPPSNITASYQEARPGAKKDEAAEAPERTSSRDRIASIVTVIKTDIDPKPDTESATSSPSSPQHRLVKCTVVEVENKAKPQSAGDSHRLMSCVMIEEAVPPQHEVVSRSPQQTHRLMSCAVVEEAVPPQSKSTGPTEHQMIECATIEEAPAQIAKSPAPSEHLIADCETISVKLAPASAAVEQHPLVECETIMIETDTTTDTTVAKQHALLECDTVVIESVAAVSSKTPDQHPLEDCDTVSILVSEAPTTIVTTQHPLERCDTIRSSDMEVLAQELSYVHDFTDCPVDKAVLEYYEKEEKVLEHQLADCRKPSTVSGVPARKPLAQHTLIDCSKDNAVIVSRGDRRSSSVSIVRSNSKTPGLREHRLVSCPTPHILSRHVVSSDADNEATQLPTKPGKQHDGSIEDSPDHSGSTSTGPNSSLDSTKSNIGPIRRKQRRRRKSSRKPTGQRPSLPAEINQFDRQFRRSLERSSAQFALSQLLAADGCIKSPLPTGGSNLASQTDGEQADRDMDNSANATRGDGSEAISEAVRSEEDPRSPHFASARISGLWSKLKGKERNGKD